MVEVLPHLQANMEVVQHILMEVEEDTNKDINKDINNHMVRVPTMSTIQHMEDTKQDLPHPLVDSMAMEVAMEELFLDLQYQQFKTVHNRMPVINRLPHHKLHPVYIARDMTNKWQSCTNRCNK